MNPEAVLRRAEAAARLLREEVVSSAFAEISAEMKDRIVSLSLDKREERECLVAEYQAVVRLLRKLRQWEGEGALARADIERTAR